jgi:hypothetical protein
METETEALTISQTATTTDKKQSNDDAQTTTTPTRAIPLVECHALPCNINFDGMAQVPIHFHPESHELKQHNERNLSNKHFYTAQFRGRGLIAKEPEQTTSNETSKNISNPSLLQGRLLSVSSFGDKIVQFQERFDCFYEWHHSHQVSAVSGHVSRVQKANHWYQISKAVSGVCRYRVCRDILC